MSRVSKRRERAESPWEYRWTLRGRDGADTLYVYLSRDRGMATWDRRAFGDGIVKRNGTPIFHNGSKPRREGGAA